jgi:hypothetical protein
MIVLREPPFSLVQCRQTPDSRKLGKSQSKTNDPAAPNHRVFAHQMTRFSETAAVTLLARISTSSARKPDPRFAGNALKSALLKDYQRIPMILKTIVQIRHT